MNLEVLQGGGVSSPAKFFLGEDITLSSANITISSGYVTLCLNGYMLTGVSGSSVITIGDGTSENAGTLILCDCKEGNTDYAHEYYVDNHLYKFDNNTIDWNTAYENAGADNQGVIYGGVITGGNTDWGGGVCVRSNSTMYMYSGTIAGNHAGTGSGTGGGGMEVDGIFYMEGGTIAGNYANQQGGGVRVGYNGTFYMNDGTITDNYATAVGGGVSTNGGAVTMSGGIITDNTTGNTSNSGRGVYLSNTKATFTMTGGFIGGSIYRYYGSTSISGGYFSTRPGTSYIATGYTAKSTGDTTWQYIVVEQSHGHTVGDDSVTFTNHLDEVTYASQSSITLSGGNYYYLATDLTCNITITGTVYLCLNGKVLTGTGSTSVITVSDDATLILCDCQEGEVENRVTVYSDTNGNTTEKTFNSGVITGGNTSSNGGGVYVYGTFNMYGGTIAGNRAVDDDYGETSDGGGVYVGYDGEFSMSGGTIAGNMAGWGGGVNVLGSFIMEDGTISDNTTNSHGGGVYVSDGSFIMKGGQISGNTATLGGGVFVSGSLSAAVTFTMTGGEILDNEATNAGGGVYVSSGRNYTNMFTMVSGTISGNSASNDGGGVYIVGKASFTMNDGTISSNNANNGGSVFVYGYSDSDTTFTMTSGYLDGSIASSGTVTISIMGGYLSQSAYESAETLSAIGEGYTAIKIGNSIWAYVVMSSSSLVHTHSDSREYTYIDAENAVDNVLTLNGGNYYLVADMKLDITITGTVYLCLNGKVLTGTGNGSVITIGYDFNEGTLFLYDCKEDETDYSHKYYVDDYLYKFDDGTTDWNTAYENAGTDNQGIIYGGVITGGNADWGGGVYVSDQGTFNMTGGTIAGNTAGYEGGGVYVDTSSTFNMTSGTIAGNSAAECGGGVFVGTNGTLNMTGGEISGNSTDYGGGVHVSYQGTFNMNGGTISGNTATEGGEGVNVDGEFTMTDGFIGGSIEGGSDATISILDGYFSTEPSRDFLMAGYMAGITGEYANFPYGIVIEPHYHGATVFDNLITSDGGTLTGGTDEGNRKYYYLAEDVTLTENIIIEGYVTICLNGYSLTGVSGSSVITVNAGANFTLCDCYGSGTITGGSATYGGAVYVNGGTFTMNGGTIAGNSAYSGGGVYVNGGTFNMNGGSTITNNFAIDGGGVYVFGLFTMTAGTIAGNSATYGGGVYVEYQSIFNMNGGEISGNTATEGGGVFVYGTFTMTGGMITENSAIYGGAVNVDEGMFVMSCGTISGNVAVDGAVSVYYGSTFIMSGGAISDNYATYGGVCVYESTFIMSDGTISGNIAVYGGGVYVYGTFYMYGGTIAGNTATYGDGLYLIGALFTMSDGYLDGSIHLDIGIISITGGYLSESAYESAIEFSAIATGYTAIETNEYEDFPYQIVHQHESEQIIFNNLVTSSGGTLTGGETEKDMVYYYLNEDITLIENITIEGYVTLCLNGHILTGNGDGSVISVKENAYFVLCDCGSGAVEGDINVSGTFIMTGGCFDNDIYDNDSVNISITGGYLTEEFYNNYGKYIEEGYTAIETSDDTLWYYIVLPSSEVEHVHNGYEYYVLTPSGGTLTGGEEDMVYYYLATDITLIENITIYGHVTLCLNGHILTGNGIGSVITILYSSSLTLCDCSTDEAGTITGGIEYWGGGVYVSGTFIMNSGTITGNVASSNGGGVYVDSGAEFIMNGGMITGNATFTDGGGVGVSGTFVMNYGTISGNMAGWGGGVGVSPYGSFTMQGGMITSNNAYNGGAGVNINDTFEMYGGTITGNTADSEGVRVVYNGTFKMYGGYVDETLVIDENGSIIITGGYLSQKAYDSILNEITNEPQYIETDYTVVDISELGKTLDNDYDANYPYAVYAKSYDEYGVLNVENATYGTTYEPTIEDDYDYVIYEWTDGDSNTYGLPTDASTYTVTAYFFTVTTTGVEEDEEITISVATATFDVTINKGTATINVTENDLNKTYDGNAVSLGANAVTVGDLEIANEADVTLVWYSVDENNEETLLESAPVNAGNYKVVITVADTDNYIGTTETIYFTISKAGLSAGAIVGIVIGSVLGALIITYAVCAILFKKGVVKGKFFEKIYPFIKIEHTQAQQEKPAQRKKSNSKPDNK